MVESSSHFRSPTHPLHRRCPISLQERWRLLTVSEEIDRHASLEGVGGSLARFWSDQLPINVEMGLIRGLEKVRGEFGVTAWSQAIQTLVAAMWADQTARLVGIAGDDPRRRFVEHTTRAASDIFGLVYGVLSI